MKENTFDENECLRKFNQFVDAANNYYKARNIFYRELSLTNCRDFILAFIRNNINNPSNNLVCLEILGNLSNREKIQLFDLLLLHSLENHGHTWKAQEIIKSLPKSWLIDNIEKYADPLIKNNDDYWSVLLDIYSDLDANLAQRLALKAIQHPDSDIREIGEWFLEKQNPSG